MTTNIILKKCPNCGYGEADICGVYIIPKVVNPEVIQEEVLNKDLTIKTPFKIISKEKIINESFNDYTCLRCKKKFSVKRSGNPEEQKLTQKFIDASKIVLVKS